MELKIVTILKGLFVTDTLLCVLCGLRFDYLSILNFDSLSNSSANNILCSEYFSWLIVLVFFRIIYLNAAIALTYERRDNLQTFIDPPNYDFELLLTLGKNAFACLVAEHAELLRLLSHS